MIPELQGMTGNGIRKVCQGRRTEGAAKIEVWLGNVSDVYFNMIHGTSIVDGHLQLTNKNSCEIHVECPDAPVESERDRTISGIDITNDPLVQIDGVFMNDPGDWYGMGRRDFTFTALEDKWYTAKITTNLVAAHDLLTGRVRTVYLRFRPKRPTFRGINIGCAEGSLNNYEVDLSGNSLPSIPPGILNAVHDGVDYVLTGDDFNYSRHDVQPDWWWGIPRNSNSSVNARGSLAPTLSSFGALAQSTMNVGDAVVSDDAWYYVWENLCTLMNPYYMYLGLHCVVAPSDIGDHGVRRANDTQFGIWSCVRPSMDEVVSVDYGINAPGHDNTDPRPADDADTMWIHAGDGNGGPAVNPYAAGITSNPAFANMKLDIESAEKVRNRTMDIFDYFWFQRWEHNVASVAPETMQVPKYLADFTFFSGDPTDSVAANGAGAEAEYYYYPRWKYMDFGDHLRLYAIDQSFWNYGQSERVTGLDRDGVAQDVFDTCLVMGEGQLSDITTHMQAAAGGLNCIAIVAGDVSYPVGWVDVNGAGGGAYDEEGGFIYPFYGQGDGIFYSNVAEHTQFLALIENLASPVLLLTSDHHVTGVSNYAPNVVEAHGAIAPLSNPRGFYLRPDQLYQHQDPGKASAGLAVGYTRVHSRPGKTTVVGKTTFEGYSEGDPLGGDGWIMSDRFVACGGPWSFEDGTQEKEKHFVSIRSSQVSFNSALAQ